MARISRHQVQIRTVSMPGWERPDEEPEEQPLVFVDEGRPFVGCDCDWCAAVRAVNKRRAIARALNPQTGIFVSPEIRAEARAQQAKDEAA